MNRPVYLLIGFSALLFSCGESGENTMDQYGQGQDPRMSELEARMAEITGQPVPESQAAGGWDQQGATEGGSGFGARVENALDRMRCRTPHSSGHRNWRNLKS